ncbi:MAG: protein kinase [Deltaproteobacteria bacterium]
MADPAGNGSRTRERLRAGTVLAARYRLEAELGSGSFGVVWRARHVHLETECAVKLFDPPPGADPQEAGARFLQEARLMARLKSPYVAQVFDYGVHEQMPFLALELLLGSSLATRLAQLRAQGLRMPAAETARIIRHVAEGLSVAHVVQVVHRDLKPENIFLVQHGGIHTAKVLDFGIAKWSADGAPRMTSTRTVMGTPHYMSPEQFEGAQNADHRSDLWSLGVIAFECLTGQLPVPGETFIDIAFRVCKQGPLVASQLVEVPTGFDAWFARATALRPEYRFASALELADALEGVCAAVAAPQPKLQPSSTVPAVTAAERLRRQGRWIAAVSAGALLLGGALWLSRSPSEAPAAQLSSLGATASSEAVPQAATPPSTEALAGALLPQAREPTVSVSQDDVEQHRPAAEAVAPPKAAASDVAARSVARAAREKARPTALKAAPARGRASKSAAPVPALVQQNKVDCKQQFWIDDRGIRRLKMACL